MYHDNITAYCQNRVNKVCQQNVCNVTYCGAYTYQNPFNGEFLYPIKACLFSLSLVINTWKVLRCDAEKDGEDHLDRSCEK
jgi:hypothetical protein